MWACGCANWATQDIITRYQDTGKLSDHCAFIEPVDTSLILPVTIGYSGDIVQFTGQYYIDKGYPIGYIKGEEQVNKAQVFRYTSYKIIKSYYRQNLVDKLDSLKYLVDKGGLNGKTKTLDVSYAAIMCTCPQWFETKYAKDTSKFEEFYLEPSSDKVISANTLYNGTNIPLRVSVTGQFYSKKGYPANYFPAKGDPKPAKVFRYDRIQIIQNGNGTTKNGL